MKHNIAWHKESLRNMKTSLDHRQKEINQLQKINSRLSINIRLLEFQLVTAKNLGKKEFFDVLKKYVTLEPEKDSKPESAKSPTETKTITGEKAKLQIGNFTFNTTFDFKDKNIGDVGLQYKTKVGNTPTTLMLKAKDPGSVGTGDFGLKNIQAGVKINIPQTNKNKPHGAML
jgi:hypothetical protein